MDGGYLVDALPLITAVVDALVVSVLLQRPVAKLRPRRPPFLGLGLLVPVGGGDGLAYPCISNTSRNFQTISISVGEDTRTSLMNVPASSAVSSVAPAKEVNTSSSCVSCSALAAASLLSMSALLLVHR